MKQPDQCNSPAALRYSAEHIWVLADDNDLLAGITDFAQDQLGEVVYVELPLPGDSFQAGEPFGSVESLKSVSSLFMPVSGKIHTVNAALEASPTLINIGPYDRGWLIRITPDDPSDVEGLLSAAGYLHALT